MYQTALAEVKHKCFQDTVNLEPHQGGEKSLREEEVQAHNGGKSLQADASFNI